MLPRISFSPDIVDFNSVNFLNNEQKVQITVSLQEPIISPEGQDIGLKIMFNSSFSGITINPNISWDSAIDEVPAPRTVTLTNKTRYAGTGTGTGTGTLNDIITTTVVTNSEYYKDFTPKFIVNYKGSKMSSLFTNNAMVYHKPGSVSSGIGGVRNHRVKGRKT
jgi:hypothetical protein